MATGSRERFLAQATVSLRDSSPSSARQLMISLTHLQYLNGNVNQSNTSRSCPACGSVNIETRTVEVARKSKDGPQKLSTSATGSQASELIISKCQTCSRARKVPLTTKKMKPLQEQGTESSDVSANESRSVREPDSKVQKTSSKKRAKERKDRQGLQSLLGKRKDDTNSSNTFDLMDFMTSRS